MTKVKTAKMEGPEFMMKDRWYSMTWAISGLHALRVSTERLTAVHRPPNSRTTQVVVERSGDSITIKASLHEDDIKKADPNESIASAAERTIMSESHLVVKEALNLVQMQNSPVIQAMLHDIMYNQQTINRLSRWHEDLRNDVRNFMNKTKNTITDTFDI